MPSPAAAKATGIGSSEALQWVCTFAAGRKAVLWQAGLTRVLGRLSGAGIPVLVVHPTPSLPSPGDCAILRLLLRDCAGQGENGQRARQGQGGKMESAHHQFSSKPRRPIKERREARG